MCRVYDETVDPNRRDVLPEDEGGAENGSLRPAALSLLRFNLVKEPTIDTITCAVINERGEAVGVSSPIASGVGPGDGVRLRFAFTTRRNKTLWELHSVQWQVPWAGTTSGSKGEIFTTEPIPPSEAHDFFDVTVTATFRRMKPILPPPPEPEYEYVTDTKSRRFPLCFSKTDHDEWNNTARGGSAAGVFDPPNWFDSNPGHAGHWGHILNDFNETDANLAGNYIVYYAPKVPDNTEFYLLCCKDGRHLG